MARRSGATGCSTKRRRARSSSEALERGINFFDTADIYSVGASEEIRRPRAEGFRQARRSRRSRRRCSTRWAPGPNARGLSRKHIMEAIDASLKRLGTDYVDLYQIHRFDHETPIEETVEALSDVVRAGKALYVGASSMWTWQFARMISVARERGFAEFVSMQNFYNLVYREEEREMMKFCADQDIAVIPWSPLARGYLAGSGARRGRLDGARPHRRLYARARPRLAPGRGDPPPRRRSRRQIRVKPAVVALAWVLVETLRHRADRRRLEAAPSRRRGRGAVAEARRAHHRQAGGAVPARKTWSGISRAVRPSERAHPAFARTEGDARIIRARANTASTASGIFAAARR